MHTVEISGVFFHQDLAGKDQHVWTPPKELLVCSVVDFCTGEYRALTPERGGKSQVGLEITGHLGI